MTNRHNHTLAGHLTAADDAYGLAERSGGHTWSEDTRGRVCARCGRRWAEVVGATTENLRQTDFACTGNLIEPEQKEFAAEVDWLWSTIVDAASSGH